jgi:ferric-dicitrate binding protein FerR (iron transport regulator)
MDKKIFERFLNNQCSRAEMIEVAEWVQSSALNEASKTWGFDEWQSLQTENSDVSDIKLNSILDRVHHKINIKKSNTRNKEFVLKSINIWITRVAAILLLPVVLYLIYSITINKNDANKYVYNVVDSLEIVAPIGSRTVVDLTDGTKIYLNYGSSIKYPQQFVGNTREVILKGEGYFEVAHNPQKPFIVKTQNMDIKALGTKFNVLAYPEDGFVATTLIEGKVVLEKNTEKEEGIGTLVPGQHVKYYVNTGKIISAKGNTDLYISWKDGKLVFQNQPLEEVALRLSRMFNVDIEISNEIKHFTYTVTFIDEPLHQILDLMTIATPVSYKSIPRTKLPDGTYSKQKIIIEKRN